MNVIAPVDDTNNIRYADFIRIDDGTNVYRFSTAPTEMTIPAVDANPFSGLGQLVKVGSAQRDIKSTANETTISLVGIDTAMLGFVLGSTIKGSQIQMWHGFFSQNNELISNNFLYSEEFNQAIWTKTRSSISANSTIAPDGTLTADKLIEDASVTTSHLTQQATSFAAGNVYTFSVYAKADTRNQIRILLPSAQFGAVTSGAYFKLDGSNAIIAAGSVTADITDVGDGWYRCSVSKICTTSGTSVAAQIYLASGNTSSYTGDGTSGLYIWGAQTNSGYLTDYLKTITAANSGLYQFFNGFINSFSISEQWMEEVRAYVGSITVSSSSIQLILQNRVAGRFTNDNSWRFFNATDSSMNRVNFISTINYFFGKDAPANS